MEVERLRYSGNRIFPIHKGKMLDLEIISSQRNKKDKKLILTCEQAFSGILYKVEIIKYDNEFYTYEVKKQGG